MKKKKQKTIYWLKKDNFNKVLYDEQVKVVSVINDKTFLIEFERWEQSLTDNVWRKRKTTAIAEQFDFLENVVFLQISER